MREYYIPNHVHFALEQDAAVFLDLRSDRYSMLIGAKAQAFKALVSRTADSIQRVVRLDTPPYEDRSSAAQDHLVADLLAHGLVTAEKPEGTTAPPTFISLPQENLLEPEALCTTNILTRDRCRFFVSCALAKWRLSCTTIEETVRAVALRKSLRGTARYFDMDKARSLVRIYNRMRPLIPHSYLCIYDSLSLLEFLSRYDCYPSWVFAVQLEPWAAHCWVQYGPFVFNETVDEARTYLPLMSI